MYFKIYVPNEITRSIRVFRPRFSRLTGVLFMFVAFFFIIIYRTNKNFKFCLSKYLFGYAAVFLDWIGFYGFPKTHIQVKRK